LAGLAKRLLVSQTKVSGRSAAEGSRGYPGRYNCRFLVRPRGATRRWAPVAHATSRNRPSRPFMPSLQKPANLYSTKWRPPAPFPGLLTIGFGDPTVVALHHFSGLRPPTCDPTHPAHVNVILVSAVSIRYASRLGTHVNSSCNKSESTVHEAATFNEIYFLILLRLRRR
jgi:hypothetical protein